MCHEVEHDEGIAEGLFQAHYYLGLLDNLGKVWSEMSRATQAR